MKYFIRYYKWHLIFFALVLACVVFLFVNMLSVVEPDLVVSYVGSQYINTQKFNDTKKQIETLLKDTNQDNKKSAAIYAHAGDTQKELDELLEEVLDDKESDIFIATRETFENCKDKSMFADVSSYLVYNPEKIDVVTDDDGRAFAVSLKGNEFVENFGIIDPTELYIAAANSGEDEMTDREKNGRNITGDIINRD